MQKSTLFFFSSPTFWGVLVILIGLSIILKGVFNLNIPILRIFLGGFIIYAGAQLIAGGFKNSKRHFIQSNPEIPFDIHRNEYNIVFGKSNIDLRNIGQLQTGKRIEINVVFGEAVVMLNDTVPTVISSTTAFGNTVLPDHSGSAFGDSVYQNSAYQSGSPYLHIETNTVFGKTLFIKSAATAGNY